MPLRFEPGDRFPDLTLPDHTGTPTAIGSLAGDRPLILVFFRGPW